MKKILRTLMLVSACLIISIPAAEAQRHQGANGGRPRHEQPSRQAPSMQRQSTPSRAQGASAAVRERVKRETPLNAGRPKVNATPQKQTIARPVSGNTGGNNGSGRPPVGVGNNGNNGNNHNPGNRPGNVKPGNNNNGGNHNQGHRPGVGSNTRPPVGNNHGPSIGGNRPGNNRPGGGMHGMNPGGHRPPVVRPPQRPHRPPMFRPMARPVPPPYWRPRRGLPVVRGILGLSFGVAFNLSLDYLFNNGYTVDGYGDNVVYLRNVPALNYMWTDAALYYGTSGLDAQSFYYSTPGYDLARYNNVYSSLVGTYGPPVSSSTSAGVMTSTWFGGNNGYVTLSFGASSGGRFLTTLTFGM